MIITGIVCLIIGIVVGLFINGDAYEKGFSAGQVSTSTTRKGKSK